MKIAFNEYSTVTRAGDMERPILCASVKLDEAGGIELFFYSIDGVNLNDPVICLGPNDLRALLSALQQFAADPRIDGQIRTD